MLSANWSRICAGAWAAVLLTVALPRAAAKAEVRAPHAAPAPTEAVDLPVIRTRLDNGLRVVLSPERGTPNVAVCVSYDVGARNEAPGQGGFAHLFEHMMFEGSRNVPKGEHFRLVAARGGTTNGTTSSELTNYYDVVPASELELALWLEADRMKTLAITQKKFENQRAVVQEEYRMRISNSAYAFGALRLRELAFQGYFPYEHAAIGSMEDLEAADLDWVARFHRDYYAPNNAVLSIAGDFDPDTALELVRKHFGDAPARADIPPFTAPPLPRQTSERLSVVEDTNAKTPGVYYGWVIPPARSPEHYALEVVAALLADGESSALHRVLVRDKAVAREVAAYTHRHRGPGLFVTKLLLTQRASVDETQKLFEAELKRLRYSGPTDAELARAKARLVSRFTLGLQSNKDRAIRLGQFEVLYGDARLVNSEIAAYEAVGRREVQLAVANHLVDGRRSIVEMYPPGWVKDEYPTVLTRTHIVRKGDTLIGIANKYGVSLADLLKQNKIPKTRAIFPGQKLVIPSSAKGVKGAAGQKGAAAAAPKPIVHVVKKGETLSGIARKYGVSVASLVQHNKVGAGKKIVVGQKLNVVREPK